jgi:hypothetical protein
MAKSITKHDSLSGRDRTAVYWTPAQVDTVTWFDAADVSTIVTAGGAVSQWDDKSGNGNHAVQSGGLQQPAHDADAQAIVFDGNDIMQVTNDPYKNLQNFAVLAVGKWNATSANNNAFASWASAGTGQTGRGWSFRERLGLALTLRPAINDGGSSVFPPFKRDFLGVGMRDPGNNIYSRINGTQTHSTNDGGAVVYDATNRSALGGVYQGDEWATPGFFLTSSSYIKELIVIENATVADVQLMEGYLAWKWGLEEFLPDAHPYKSEGALFGYEKLTLLEEDFEAPVVSGYSEGSTPTGWTRASTGFGATRHGLDEISSGDWAATSQPANTQAYAFKYTNSGLASSAGEIDKIEVTRKVRYRLSIDIGYDKDLSVPWGTTKTITVFADAGGGLVTVTAVSHTYANGERVKIEGTTNYNGYYTISNVTTDTFDITATFAGDDATGTAKRLNDSGVFKIQFCAVPPGHDYTDFTGGGNQFTPYALASIESAVLGEVPDDDELHRYVLEYETDPVADAAKAGYDLTVAVTGFTNSAVIDNVKVERIERIGS